MTNINPSIIALKRIYLDAAANLEKAGKKFRLALASYDERFYSCSGEELEAVLMALEADVATNTARKLVVSKMLTKLATRPGYSKNRKSFKLFLIRGGKGRIPSSQIKIDPDTKENTTPPRRVK